MQTEGIISILYVSSCLCLLLGNLAENKYHISVALCDQYITCSYKRVIFISYCKWPPFLHVDIALLYVNMINVRLEVTDVII